MALGYLAFVRLYAIYFVGCADIVPSLWSSAESPFRLKISMSAHVASMSIRAVNLKVFKLKLRVLPYGSFGAVSFVQLLGTQHRAGPGNLWKVTFRQTMETRSSST